MNSPREAETFFQMDAQRYKGECGYQCAWPNVDDATNAELMFLAVLCETLAAQFKAEVIERVGEERAYYLEEYQKASLKDFTARYKAQLARAVQLAEFKEKEQLDEALTLIRRRNPQFDPGRFSPPADHPPADQEQTDDHDQA